MTKTQKKNLKRKEKKEILKRVVAEENAAFDELVVGALHAPNDDEEFHDAVSAFGDEDDAETCDLDFFPLNASSEGQDSGPRPGDKMIEITVDSGAGAPVANPGDFTNVEVTPSAGSLAGQKFVGPGNEIIHNEGKFTADLLTEPGDLSQITFQAAQVRKPLLAVSGVNQKGNGVWFDGHESCILPPGPTLNKIRAMVAQAQPKVPLHLKNGVFTMRCWQPGTPFAGRGR